MQNRECRVLIYEAGRLVKNIPAELMMNRVFKAEWEGVPEGTSYSFELLLDGKTHKVFFKEGALFDGQIYGTLYGKGYETLKIHKSEGVLISYDMLNGMLELKKAYVVDVEVDVSRYMVEDGEAIDLTGTFVHWKINVLPMERICRNIYRRHLVLDEGEYEYKIHLESSSSWLPVTEGLKLYVGEKSENYPVGDIDSGTFVENAIKHNPYQLRYLNSIGNKEIEISLRVQREDVKKAEVIFLCDDREIILEMEKSLDKNWGFEYLRALVKTDMETPRFKYYFILYDNKGKSFFTPSGLDSRLSSYFEADFDIDENLYRFDVPEWSRHAIWYCIIPDRFFKGNHCNQPIFNDYGSTIYKKPEEITSSPDFLWSREAGFGFTPNSWTSNFERSEPWEEKIPDSDYSKYFRKYAGDLEGINQKIPYLKKLGIDAIYLTPVFHANSHIKYDALDFRHICPDLGTNRLTGSMHGIKVNPYNICGGRSYLDVLGGAYEDREEQELLRIRLTGSMRGKNGLNETMDTSTWVWTESDLIMADLIKQLHQNGIRIIFDVALNHCSLNNWILDMMLMEGKESQYASWFKIKEFGDIGPIDPDLPESKAFEYLMHNRANTRYDGWKDGLPEYNSFNSEYMKYVVDICRKWLIGPDGKVDDDLGSNDGIDGFRVDAPLSIDMYNWCFWKEWRQEIKIINKNAYIVQETWIEDKKNMNEGRKYDAVMNYEWLKTVLHYFVNKGEDSSLVTYKLKPSEFFKLLAAKKHWYPLQVTQASFNLTGSHDTDRLYSRVVNDKLGRTLGNSDRVEYGYKTIRPDLAEKGRNTTLDWRTMDIRPIEIVKLIYVFQMTYIGAPLIYYGDEVGMWGASDPYSRKPMLWADFEYEDETDATFDGKSEKYGVKPDMELFDYVSRLISIRKSSECFTTGYFKEVLADDFRDVIAYKRFDEKDEFIVVINNSFGRSCDISVQAGKSCTAFREVLHNLEFRSDNNGSIHIDAPGKSAYIIKIS